MTDICVAIQRLTNGADLPLPQYATTASAGADLLAAIDRPVTLMPGARTVVPSGIAIQLPAGYEAQVRPRSGLAAKHGVTVLNSPGTIDADYRGEIAVIMINLGSDPFVIKRGMRIAQMVVAPIQTDLWNEVVDCDNSERGSGGFGSTGTDGTR